MGQKEEIIVSKNEFQPFESRINHHQNPNLKFNSTPQGASKLRPYIKTHQKLYAINPTSSQNYHHPLAVNDSVVQNNSVGLTRLFGSKPGSVKMVFRNSSPAGNISLNNTNNESLPENDVAGITTSIALPIPFPKLQAIVPSYALSGRPTITANPIKVSNNFTPYWTLTMLASNDWGHYQLDNEVPDNNLNNQSKKEDIDERENHEFSFSTGIMLAGQFSRHLGIKTGFIYSNNAIVIDPQEIYASVEPDGGIAYKFITSSGYGYVKPGFNSAPAVGDSLQSATAQHNLQSVAIPLMLSYRVSKNNLSLITSFGLAANFVTHATVKTEVTSMLNNEIVNIKSLKGTRKFYPAFWGDVNLQYDLTSKLAINIIPSFKIATSPLTKNNVVKTYPNSFAIGTGITFKL